MCEMNVLQWFTRKGNPGRRFGTTTSIGSLLPIHPPLTTQEPSVNISLHPWFSARDDAVPQRTFVVVIRGGVTAIS